MHDLTSVIQSFAGHLQFEKRFSRHTLRAYTDDLHQFRDFLLLSFDIQTASEIASVHVRSWMAALKESGITARSINRKLSTLKSFFKYLVRVGQLEQSPLATVISPKVSKRLPAFVPEKELLELLESMKYSDDWKGYNARLIITLFYSTGIRLSELIGLRTASIDRGGKTIKVLGKGNKERILPLSPQVITLIEQYEEEKKKVFKSTDEALFVTEKGKRLYPKYVYLLVKQYLSAIKTLEKKSPHILRHSFATHLADHGAELNAVKELLGHTSLAATQVYTHNSIDKLRQVYRSAHPRERRP
jgi:integrase/recombinase XerC